MKAQLRPSIQSLRFDTSGWTVEGETADVIKWTNEKTQFLSLHFFAKQPDIPCSLDSIDALRLAYRLGLGQSGGALISVDCGLANGLDCVQLVFKTPRQPHGMVYVGSLTFPLADFSYVIKVQSAEFGTTGVRDSLVMDMLMRQGAVQINPASQQMEGWSADPYDPTFKSPLLANRSDDEQYDKQFPDHPLSGVRQCLYRVVETVSGDESVTTADKFDGPGGRRAQPQPAQPSIDRFQQQGMREQMPSQQNRDEDSDAGDADQQDKKSWWKKLMGK